MTPLYDAIGRGVDGLDKRAGNGKAVLVIVTDGLENYSSKHTFDSIRELIDARQDKGWLIVFLGAGFAAAQQGTAMGIQAGSVANIGMDEHSLHNTMASVRCMMEDYAATPDLAEAKAYAAGAAFSIKARAAMGDASGGSGLVKPKSGKNSRPKQATAIAHPLATAFEKMRVQRLEALEHRDRHQEVPSRIPAEPLDLALVVALARAAEAVLEQVVRLQFGEDACPLALAVA